MAAAHAENQPSGDVNNRDQERPPLDVPGFQNGSHERRTSMSLQAPESPKSGKQQQQHQHQASVNHHNYDGMAGGGGSGPGPGNGNGGPQYGRPDHGMDQPTGDGESPKVNNFEQAPPDKDGYPPPSPGGFRNSFGHHPPINEQHHTNSNSEPNSFNQFRHAYSKPMMRVPGPPGAMFPQQRYHMSGQSISQPTGPTPTLNQLLQSSNPATRYQNNYSNEYQKPDGQPPPPVQNQQHYNQTWPPPPRHNMPPYPPQHGMPYRNVAPGANPRGPTPPPSPGHPAHYPPPPSSPTGYQQHHRVPPLHHQYPPGPPGPPPPQQQQQQQPQQTPYGSYPNQQQQAPHTDRQQQQQQPQIPPQPHVGGPGPTAASPPAAPPVPQSQNAQQHPSPPPQQLQSPQQQQQPPPPPHQSPPQVHPDLTSQNSNDSNCGGGGTGNGGTPLRPSPSPTGSTGSRSMSPAVTASGGQPQQQQNIPMPPRPPSSQPQQQQPQPDQGQAGQSNNNRMSHSPMGPQQGYHQQPSPQSQGSMPPHMASPSPGGPYKMPAPSPYGPPPPATSHGGYPAQQPPPPMGSYPQQPPSNYGARPGLPYQGYPPTNSSGPQQQYSPRTMSIHHGSPHQFPPYQGWPSNCPPQVPPPLNNSHHSGPVQPLTPTKVPPPSSSPQLQQQQQQQQLQQQQQQQQQQPQQQQSHPHQPPSMQHPSPAQSPLHHHHPHHPPPGPHMHPHAHQMHPMQQGPSPGPPPPVSPGPRPHTPPHPHYLKQHLQQQHKMPGGYQSSGPVPPSPGPGNYCNSMSPHSMGPPAPVQSNAGAPMAPPNSMMSVDHEGSQQQNLSGVVTSVITTGPDGTAIDDASQQSTLSNASAASGDDSNCTTPKRKENMSGSMMYQQGMGGVMGPPCSPAHDEYSNPEPMAPAWSRGPPPHNPVFNSHMAPSEHIYRPKKHDSLSKLYEMDENPERRIWLDKLLQFMDDRGTPISTCPTISKNPLDLFRLYIYVKERGGFMEVCKVTKNKIWKDVAGLLGIGASSSAAYTLRKHYTKNLLPYECHFDRGGIDPVPIINQIESSTKKKSSKATSVPSPGSAGSNSQDSLPSAPNAQGSGHVDGYPGYGGGYGGPQDYNSPQRPPHPPHGMQGSYQGPSGYNQYPSSNDQYGQHYPPASAPVSYPTGPVRPSIYPPYSNEADRNYGGSAPPQGPPNIPPQGPGNGPDPYNRGPVPSGYQQPPRFPGPPLSNSTPTTANQTQGVSVSTPGGFPPTGQPPQSDYYRQEPPASPGYSPNSAPPGAYPGKGMPPPQPRRHPDFAKDQAGPPQPAGYPGYGPQQRPMYPGPSPGPGPGPGPGWSGTPNAASQYPRPGYPPGSQPPQNWSQGPPRSIPPSHLGQPPQWDQHRYPSQGQPYGAQQNHWGSMPQSPMRMPRHGYRPDGSKPYGPHGSMAPPSHIKPGMSGQPMFQGSGLLKRDVIFPPESVESVTPILYKRRRITRQDITPVDGWRLMMSLRSGLLAESTWALDVLNILLFDDSSIPYFGLSHMPGLLDILLEHFRQSLVNMLETDIKSYCWYEKSKVVEDIPEIGIVDNINTSEKAYFPDPSIPPQRPIKNSAIVDGSKELFIKNGKRPWDVVDNYDMGYNIAETDTNFLVPCFRSEFGLVPFVKLLKSNKVKVEDVIEDDKTLVKKEDEEFDDKDSVRNGIDNVVNNKNIKICDPMGVLQRKSISEYEDESYSKDESSLSLISDSQDTIGKRCVCISNILRNLSFVPGNELEFSKSGPYLGLVGKLLLTHHEHPLRSSKTRNYDKADDDTELLFNCTTTTDADTIEPGNDPKWWWDYLDVVRENLLVSLANIAGYVDLSTFNEDVSRPILDGLLHWAICPAAAGQDPFPTAPLSPQRLALECLCKLCVTDSNVDLVIATPPYSRLEKLANVLTRLLCRTEEQVLREFAVNLLHYLAAADSSMARTIALQSPCVSLLVAFIEQTEQNALSVVNTHGLNALRDNPDSMGTSLDMLRRAARILLLLSRHPDNRPLFLQQEQRLLSLVMSQILDQQVAALISRVLFQCSRNTPSPFTQ